MESTLLPTVREDLLANLEEHWLNYETKPLYAMATLVDPRYKECGFNDTSATAYAIDLVLTEMMTNLHKSTQSCIVNNTGQNVSTACITADNNTVHFQLPILSLTVLLEISKLSYSPTA
jgi:hypothetical protein